MAKDKAGASRTPRRRVQDRIIAPVGRDLRIAGWLSIFAGALWPLQAAAIAWAVSGWVDGHPPFERAVPAAFVFLLSAVVRAGLEHRAGALLYDASDRTIARERAALLRREARVPSEAGSAQIAALIVQKLPLLQPWITRYHVAMMRASVLPLFLFILAFSQSWVVGLTLLIAGPLIPVFMALVGMAAEDASRRQMDEIGTMNDMLMDRLAAMLDIRLLGASRTHCGGFRHARRDVAGPHDGGSEDRVSVFYGAGIVFGARRRHGRGVRGVHASRRDRLRVLGNHVCPSARACSCC